MLMTGSTIWYDTLLFMVCCWLLMLKCNLPPDQIQLTDALCKHFLAKILRVPGLFTILIEDTEIKLSQLLSQKEDLLLYKDVKVFFLWKSCLRHAAGFQEGTGRRNWKVVKNFHHPNSASECICLTQLSLYRPVFSPLVHVIYCGCPVVLKFLIMVAVMY